MILNLKTLGLALMAVLAMSAVAASTASAGSTGKVTSAGSVTLTVGRQGWRELPRIIR